MDSNSTSNGTRRGMRSGRQSVPGTVLSLFLTLALLLVPFSVWAQTESAPASEIKNIIFMIGDGMSFQQLASARIVKGAPLVMDGLPVQHLVRNASLNNAVTDSAAAATALATGHRTNNGMIAMTPDGENIVSVLRLAKAAGKATGVVVTDMLYGATPGAFTANAPSRNDSTIILEQAIFETQPNVLLGGGMTVFNQLRGADRLHETAYDLVRTRDELLAWDVTAAANILGIFAPVTMTYEVDRQPNEPHIAEMAQVALDILSQDENGFFLMVEGSRIDHAGHANDLRRSVRETLAFDEAVAVALTFAAGRGDTLVIVTADHETGGLTPGAGTPARQVISQGVDAVLSEMMTELKQTPDSDIYGLFERYAGITDIGSHTFQGGLSGLLKHILEQRAFYYTTGSHTSAPVPVMAYGPRAEEFATVEHIADIGGKAIALLGLASGGDH